MLKPVILAGSAAFASTSLADSYVFGGTSGGSGWQWSGAGMLGLRDEISDPTNFGPGGIVDAVATTTVLASLTPDSLALIDCFVSPANPDSEYSAQELQDIREWFLAGGDLWLMNDRNDFDALGDALGIPTGSGPGFGSGSFSATVTGTGPLVDGPFGAVDAFTQYYLVGNLNAATVASNNGIVVATNSSGVALAYWPEGTFAPGAGKLVIVTDVDTYAGNVGYTGGADYNAMNSNAKLGLNTAAFFVPAPSAAAVFWLGAAGALRRRRR